MNIHTSKISIEANLIAFASPRVLLTLSCVTTWIWIFFATLLNESQLNDSLEQFIWAQSFEWGYWKHPPLSTWLMGNRPL